MWVRVRVRIVGPTGRDRLVRYVRVRARVRVTIRVRVRVRVRVRISSAPLVATASYGI